MASLVLDDIDEKIVQALKVRADKQGISTDAEHRRILEAVLLPCQEKSFVDSLMAMPNVGLDADFEGLDEHQQLDVFD